MAVILQINIFANSGSHGRIVESIGRLAIEEGWRSIIAYGRAANQSDSELIRIGSDWSIRAHVVESRLFDNHGLASRRATKRFIEQVKELKPDIVHLHVIHGYYLNYKLLFEYLNSTCIPVVWTFHDTWAYTGHCGHYGSVNCQKWKTQCDSCPLMWKDYPKSVIDRSKKNYELKKKLFNENKNLHIVTVSNWLKQEVEQSFFHDKDIRVISNGIDLNVFQPVEVKRQLKNRSVTRVLGVASQWGKLKGLQDFFTLRGLLPESEFEIVLVGLSNEQLQNLPAGIKGIKRTESVYNLTYADSFPTTNVEALACGIQVVTYNIGGAPEILDKETGYIIERGDIMSVAESIKKIRLNTEEERIIISRKCRERAGKFFDSNSCFMKYISLYNNVLQGNGFMILGVSAVWGPVKGLEDYIKLSELLEEDEVIVLVGVSKEQTKMLPNNIIGLPKNDEVGYLVQLYNWADVTLSLSIAETFGLTIVESLACGTPAIVYNNTALPDLINDHTGFAVQTGDIDGLYDAIQTIKRIGKKHYSSYCRESAERYFDEKKSFLDYIKLYEELLHE